VFTQQNSALLKPHIMILSLWRGIMQQYAVFTPEKTGTRSAWGNMLDNICIFNNANDTKAGQGRLRVWHFMLLCKIINYIIIIIIIVVVVIV
jgi:hypothetical protein